MNESDYMINMVNDTMEYVGGKPLPGEADQPDDREEMEQRVLHNLYVLMVEARVFGAANEYHQSLADEIASIAGLSKEWEQFLSKMREVDA